jgi:hypothetical protein
MAAKKRKRARKAEKPEGVIAPAVGTLDASKLHALLKAGNLKIDRKKLEGFIKKLEREGIDYPKVRFVARNAPFMRRPPIPAV